MGSWGPEPDDPKTEGYSITLRVHDELGNPVSGDGFWVQDFKTAIANARKIRALVLGKPDLDPARQLTLDDVPRSTQ